MTRSSPKRANEIAGDLKGAAVDADVLAHQEHAIVRLQRDRHRFSDRLGKAEITNRRSHNLRPSQIV